MAENNKIYITANELAEMLGVSVGHAYKLIRITILNQPFSCFLVFFRFHSTTSYALKPYQRFSK